MSSKSSKSSGSRSNERTSVGSFGTFLETVRLRGTNPNVGSGQSSVSTSGQSTERTNVINAPLRLVKILHETGPMNVETLRQQDGTSFFEFAKALKAATDMNLVQVHSGKGDDIVQLTAVGEKLAGV